MELQDKKDQKGENIYNDSKKHQLEDPISFAKSLAIGITRIADLDRVQVSPTRLYLKKQDALAPIPYFYADTHKSNYTTFFSPRK